MTIFWALWVAASRARHCAVAIAVLAALPPAPAAGAPAASSAGGVTIGIKSSHTAIELAASELVKYLGLMAGDHRAAAVLPRAEGAVASLQLGLFSDFGVSVAGVADPARDDAIYVDVRNSRGVIAGSNPRSVLFAAYRFIERRTKDDEAAWQAQARYTVEHEATLEAAFDANWFQKV